MTSCSRALPIALAATLIAAGLGSQPPAVAQPPAADGQYGRPTYSAEVEARIARITGDVPPPYVIDEASRVKTSLAERMQALAVPGVSIAVINDGKL